MTLSIARYTVTSGLLSCAVLFGLTARVSTEQSPAPVVTLPASPVGQAAVQLGGRWEKTADGPRYRDGKWIVVDYGRPLLRGRKDIFGSGGDYGATIRDGSPVWRVGANDTTRLTTQAALQLGDKTLAPGIYNVLAEMRPSNWTLVINTQPVQPTYDPNDKVRLYGAYNYDPKFDVLRVPMNVRPSDVSVEQLTIGFVNVTDTSATLSIAWDRTVATVEIRLASTSR